ncbi:CpsD/CapB family tyrosine-protein kinase [Sphingosinicella sp. CPCC 101087]|uniref:CpsD/CapB family tyrosine-protein kinase n=1 Tax=Sphingosinicella sp. CPCC 101087 TaxID=2497754 RepID=UPI00101BF431|nr:CpsD/CapB family tyrosine-protein kinase [Sphingosinicella sp. CPCC 101087]
MKHSRISLIERAAEVYDFGAALRARTVQPDPEPLPVVEAGEPEREAPAPVPALEPESEAVFVSKRPIAPHRPEGAIRVSPIDRDALAEAGYIVPEAPATGLAEEVRLLKRQLLAMVERRVSLPEEKRRSVLITSAQSGDGKSFCATNLALSLAGERGLEVLLIDGDFTKRDALAILGIEDGPGLVDVLADPSLDPESLVIRTDVPGLSVLPGGRRDHAVPELLASDRTREVLAGLIASDPRRIILLDSPPVLMASPATVLAGHVGQVLVVVRADRTTEADLRETVGLLVGCDNVALILNGAAIAVSGRNFGSYEALEHEA